MLIRPISYITNIVTNDNSYNKYPKYYSNPSFLAKYDAVASFKNKSKNCTINHIYPKQKYTLEYVFSDTDIEKKSQLFKRYIILNFWLILEILLI